MALSACLAILTAVSPAPQSEVRVTAELDAMPVSRALKELAPKAGLTFETTGDVGLDVVLLRVHDMPLFDLLERIAKVTACEWTRSGTTYRLGRSVKVTKQQEKEDVARVAAWVKEQIDKLNPPGAPAPYDEAAASDAIAKLRSSGESLESAGAKAKESDYEARRRLTAALTPSERATRGLVRCLDPAAIAALPPFTMATFSTRPTRMQRTLGAAGQAVLKQFSREEGYFIAAAQGMDDRKARDLAQLLGRYSHYRVPIVEPAMVEMSILDWGAESTQVRTLFLDAEGYLIDLGGQSFSTRPPKDPSSLPGFDSWHAAKWDLSERSRELSKLLGGVRPPRQADSVLEHPATVDPLSFHAQDFVVQVAARLKANVVACLPDETVVSLAQIRDPSMTLGDAAKAVAPVLSASMENGVLTVTPALPSRARKARLARAPLEALIAAHRNRGVVKLQDSASYALEQRDGNSQVEWLWFTANGLDGSSSPAMYGLEAISMGYREAFRFYGLLTESQRAMLAAGGELSVQQLTPQARRELEYRLFNRETRLRPLLRSNDNSRFARLIENPTTLLPDGLPPQTTIRMKVDVEQGAFLDQDGKLGRFWDCSGIGYVQSMQDRGDFLDPVSGYPNMSVSKFYPGSQTNLRFELTYAEGLTDSLHLRDVTVDRSTNPVLWKELPRAQFEAANKVFEYYNKIPFNRKKDPPPARR